MAEIQESGGGGSHKGGKIRSKKASTHVDMTAMVDLAFLLLTFFLLTTTFNKPQTMEIVLPDKQKDPNEKPTEVAESRAFTVMLSKSNRIFWYTGLKDPKVNVTNFGAQGIRKILREKLAVQPKLVVLIKADDDAKYRNFVDILDEMNINKVPTYAIVDITPKEVEMIKTAEAAAQPK